MTRRNRCAPLALLAPLFLLGLLLPRWTWADETALRPSGVPGPATRSRAELAELVRSALDDPRADAAQQLSRDHAALVSAFQRQEDFLRRSHAHGAGWQRHLQSGVLAAELAKTNGGDLARLAAILPAYKSGHAGLERQPLYEVRGTLEQYCRSLRAARLDDPAHEYHEHLTRLAQTLERGRLRSRSYEDIAASLAWLDQHGFAPTIVAALRDELVQPNLSVQLSGRALCSQLDRTLDEALTINDTLNGAHVTGRGRLTGHVTFDLVPHHDRAAIRLRVDGQIQTRTTARSGPVGLEGTGLTHLTGQKLILADGDTFQSLPAQVSAETRLRPTGVWSTFRGPVLDRAARRIGWQRNLDSLPSSAWNVSRRAERDLRRRIDAEAATLVASLEQAYIDQVRVPFSRHHIFPERVGFRTTHEHLLLDATLVAPGQLAAMSPPPTHDSAAIASLAIHESFFNNMTDTALSGRTLQSTELAGVLEKMLGETPFGFESVDGVPWEITVADHAPLEIRLGEGDVHVTIRCCKVVAGPEMFDVPFAVGAKYLATIDGDAIVFHRQGGLGVSGPAVGGIGKLSDGVTDSTAKIAERFEMLLQEELRFTADLLPFTLPITGKLVPKRLVLSEGWMHLALDTTPATPPTAIATGSSR
ncbi:MAG: hypothetical protein KF708_02375 [Pirellulales bacterium]|nr:hypothetical protein [Pirellulales bacterium]